MSTRRDQDQVASAGRVRAERGEVCGTVDVVPWHDRYRKDDMAGGRLSRSVQRTGPHAVGLSAHLGCLPDGV